ncbi:unnamed protein product [Paramecium pentaurelia]|uniref:Uncharacterized protein n=1 Tax=Paramecium pentaurelia TaxID=43138 RepID=A0A8S1VNP1_9CILI|nr:unnamed protein product [Paramecium pentaurelia]
MNMIYVNQAQKPKQSIAKRSSSGTNRSPFIKTHEQQAQYEPIPTRQEQIYKKTCEDLRQKIKTFNQLQRCNIIIFGPSGSGKSSLIRTFNTSLNQTQTLPEALCIKDLLHNEGTKHFQSINLLQSTKNQIFSKMNSHLIQNCQINILDTRGQINLSSKENKQVELMLEGKVKNMSLVEQRTYRYAYKLWEFWKQDCELFPQEIISCGTYIPHQVLIVFDGSLDKVPNGKEEIEFYQQILSLVKQKGYDNPFIILTQLDKLEYKFRHHDDYQLYIDQRIESIVQSLKIPRESVFFIENYHGQQQSSELDYQALRLLYECLQQASKYQIQSVECKFF